MSQAVILEKIHEDLELLKKDMVQIKQVINLEPELRAEVKLQVQEARKRIAQEKYVHNKDILREFGVEWVTK